MFYFKLGWRNLLKNYRRSIKTLLTVVIGLSACLLAQGFMSHSLWGLRESLINGGLGHFQLYQQGYLEHPNDESYQYVINNTDSIVAELQEIPVVTLWAPRLNFQGMISAGERSTVFKGTAGLPKVEQTMNSFADLKEGSFLNEQNPYGILIGSGLARKLSVGVGDNVTIMSAMKDGGVNALDMEVIGIIEMQIKAYNDVVLLANLQTVQDFIGLPNSVGNINLLLSKTENVAQIKPRVAKLCEKLGLEFTDWQQSAGTQYTQPKLFFELVNMLIMSIIILIVIFSIINTMNLTVLERVREIGTIRSLGTTRLQIGKIFIVESFLIGFIGGLVGISLGYGLAALLNGLGGIPIPPPPGQARGYIALFNPGFIQAIWLWLLFLITATVAGFYPAYKSARLQIVDALRWI